MDNTRNSYGNILKAVGLFGGVKVFQILVSIIKNKIVAVLLGPSGMGVAGMFTSTTSMVNAFTGLGLHTSSVRDISKAYSAGKKEDINLTVSVLRYLVVMTGILGALVVFLFAKYLSIAAFGTDEYTLWFRIVSLVLFLDQICVGQTALMQGTFHYKYMAKSSLIGSVLGLLLTAPLYYIWGLNAIIPVIIGTSVISLILSSYYAYKIPYSKLKLSIKQIFTKGRVMIILGIAIALSGLVNTGKMYLLRVAISHFGNLADVGLYTAGIAIANQYIDVILTSMGSDYSPRLAAIASDRSQFVETINKQIKLLVTIIAPLIILFVSFIKELTILLYSDKFLPIAGLLEWVMFGMFFRAISWSMSYSYVARGDTKAFLGNELFTALYSLAFSILGYIWFGFDGMGIAFCLTYVVYMVQLYFLSKKRFGYYVSNETLKGIIPILSLSFIAIILLIYIQHEWYRTLAGLMFTLIISVYSYKNLSKMIDTKAAWKRIKSKF